MATIWKAVTGFFKSKKEEETMAKEDDVPVIENRVQNQNDVNDDGEESTDIEDEDFIPDANEGAVSEDLSDDADEDAAQKSKTEKKKSRGKKRKRSQKVTNRKRRKADDGDSDSDDSTDDADFCPDTSRLEDDDDPSVKPLSIEEAKAREEDEKAEMDRLWADFKSSVEAEKERKNKKERTVDKVVNKVYDFAGEKVSVQETVKVSVANSNETDKSRPSLNNGVDNVFKVPQSPAPSTPSPNQNDGEKPGPSSQMKMNGDCSPNNKGPGPTKPSPSPRQRRGGISILGNDPETIGLDDMEKRGLSGLLKAFKNKSKSIGTLEKSKLDWESFKRQQGLEEELHHHNRSRDTFIDKQEFLQRTDYRQFEIEKNMRATARSKRLAN